MTDLFIQSCHASLEYDHAHMFHDLGFGVHGDFDIGSKQRKKLPGITDVNSNRDDFGLIILHQVPDYVDVMRSLLQQGKRVILVSFGQTDTWQYQAIGTLCRDFPHAYVAPYSKKDERLHVEFGAPSNKVRMIRFGKYLDDFQPWSGEGGYIYASCNSIQHRGDGCGWIHMEGLLKEAPIVLSGKETQEVGGLGEISESSMRDHFRDACGFLSLGTAPAAMVLTQIEAWCAGCPTVIYDNGHGIAGEGVLGIIDGNIGRLVAECHSLIENREYRASRHRDSLANAENFDVAPIGRQWVELIKEVMA